MHFRDCLTWFITPKSALTFTCALDSTWESSWASWMDFATASSDTSRWGDRRLLELPSFACRSTFIWDTPDSGVLGVNVDIFHQRARFPSVGIICMGVGHITYTWNLVPKLQWARFQEENKRLVITTLFQGPTSLVPRSQGGSPCHHWLDYIIFTS